MATAGLPALPVVPKQSSYPDQNLRLGLGPDGMVPLRRAVYAALSRYHTIDVTLSKVDHLLGGRGGDNDEWPWNLWTYLVLASESYRLYGNNLGLLDQLLVWFGPPDAGNLLCSGKLSLQLPSCFRLYHLTELALPQGVIHIQLTPPDPPDAVEIELVDCRSPTGFVQIQGYTDVRLEDCVFEEVVIGSLTTLPSGAQEPHSSTEDLQGFCDVDLLYVSITHLLDLRQNCCLSLRGCRVSELDLMDGQTCILDVYSESVLGNVTGRADSVLRLPSCDTESILVVSGPTVTTSYFPSEPIKLYITEPIDWAATDKLPNKLSLAEDVFDAWCQLTVDLEGDVACIEARWCRMTQSMRDIVITAVEAIQGSASDYASFRLDTQTGITTQRSLNPVVVTNPPGDDDVDGDTNCLDALDDL